MLGIGLSLTGLATRRNSSFSPAALFANGADGGYYSVAMGRVWKDTARTIPATADGDQVAALDDLSPNGRHLLQATSASQPILRFDATLNRWYLECSTSQWMASAGTLTYAVATGSYIAWGGSTSSAVAATLFGVGASGTDFHKFTTLTGAPRVQASARKASGQTVAQNTPLPYTANALVALGSQEKAGTTDLVVNKGMVTATNLHTTETVSTAAVILGALNAAAGQPAPQKFYVGVAVRGIIAMADRRSVQDWIAARLGLALQGPIFPILTAPAASQSITIPESTVSPTPAGKGLQALNATRFASDPADIYWLSNFGAQGSGTQNAAVPTIVRYNLTSNTILAEQPLLPVFPGSKVIQGIAAKDADHSMFIAYPATGRVEHFSITDGTTAPVDLGNGFAFTGANGITYDSKRGCLWLANANITGQYSQVAEDGTVISTVQIKSWPLNYEMDQLWYEASSDRLYISLQFGQVTRVFIVDPPTGDLFDFITLPGLVEGEGAFMVGNTLYVFSDGYFHTITGADVNKLFGYDVTGLLW